MRTHKYVVTECQEAPRLSHRSFLFPECVYTLKRAPDGSLVRVTLSKSLRWKPGDVVEVADLVVDEATIQNSPPSTPVLREERSAS
jgi:hypothetical protein